MIDAVVLLDASRPARIRHGGIGRGRDENMVSHKVKQILRSMGAPFTDDEMEEMEDQEG